MSPVRLLILPLTSLAAVREIRSESASAPCAPATSTCPSEMPSIAADLLVLQAFDVVQQERRPATVGSVAMARSRSIRSDRAEHRHRRRHRRRVRFVQRVRLAGPSASGGCGGRPGSDSSPDDTARCRATIRPEAAQLPIRQQENVLEQIVGVPVRADHPARQIEQPRCVLPYSASNAACVARPDAATRSRSALFTSPAGLDGGMSAGLIWMRCGNTQECQGHAVQTDVSGGEMVRIYLPFHRQFCEPPPGGGHGQPLGGQQRTA